MYVYVLVFLGGGLGAILRHSVNVTALSLLGGGFPTGTLTVNIVGSFVMGLLVEGFALKMDPGQHWRLFLTTGILGGFTTFSAFSLETALMVERGATIMAAGYVGLSVLTSVAALFLGLYLIRAIAGVLP